MTQPTHPEPDYQPANREGDQKGLQKRTEDQKCVVFFFIILSTQVSVLEIYCTPIYQANLYTAINLQPLVLP